MPRKWTLEELELLGLLWANTSTEEVGRIIGRRGPYCWKKAKDLGLKRSPEFEAELLANQTKTLTKHGVKSRFKKGSTAHNKGKKWDEFMPKESQQAARRTHYKKKNVPYNWKPIGWERVTRDGYVEVKVRDDFGQKRINNFELKHRLLWESVNGPIPDKCMVKFKDGNPRNIVIENLFISSMKDNLLNNSYCDTSIVKRFLGIKEPEMVEMLTTDFPQIVALKRQQLKLNQKIKKLCKKN